MVSDALAAPVQNRTYIDTCRRIWPYRTYSTEDSSGRLWFWGFISVMMPTVATDRQGPFQTEEDAQAAAAQWMEGWAPRL